MQREAPSGSVEHPIKRHRVKAMRQPTEGNIAKKKGGSALYYLAYVGLQILLRKVSIKRFDLMTGT